MTTKKNRKFEGKHDWSGSCSPDGKEYSIGWKTFSVGIFKWVPASTVGIKKSAVKYRITGPVQFPQKVADRAEEMCDVFDAADEGILLPPRRKSEVVK